MWSKISFSSMPRSKVLQGDDVVQNRRDLRQVHEPDGLAPKANASCCCCHSSVLR